MASAIYRYAVSFLNKRRVSEALNEELLADHDTGETLVKTNDAAMISYDAISRLNSSVEKLKSIAILKNSTPIIHEVQLNNPLPRKVLPTENIILNDTIDITGKKKLVIYIDVDRVLKSGNQIVPMSSENVNVNYSLKFANASNATVKELSSSIPLINFNSLTFDIESVIKSNPTVTKVTIEKIALTDSSKPVCNYMIAHNIMILEI